MTEAQIKHMTDRFLAWRLPVGFNPDAGISYERPNYDPSIDFMPSGTNLFDAGQAQAMVRYMVEGLGDTAMRQDVAEFSPNPREELVQSSIMIRLWIPECFPANEKGQVHFVRAVVESVADAIDRALAEWPEAASAPAGVPAA